MNRTISSGMTFFFKFVFPVIWIGFAGLYIIVKFLAGGDLSITLLAFLIGGLVIILWISIKIKKVEIDYTSKIYVSNYRKVIEIQLQDIKSVSGSVCFAPELVWFNLSRASEFGKRVIFMPPSRLGEGFSVHSIVKELEELVTLSHIVKDSNGE